MLAALLLAALFAQDRGILPALDEDRTDTVSREASPDEITIYGNSDMSRFRSAPIDGARWVETPLRPVFKLPGEARATVHAEQRSLPGASAPAAMVRLTIPLGGKKKPKK